MTSSTMTTRRYSELETIASFEERYSYLRLGGAVGATTFGFDRHINQAFYRSTQWKQVREFVIVRDNGCDLGVRGREVNGAVLIHHMNPVEVADIVHGEEWILDPEYLITTTQATHNAIHYGDQSLLSVDYVERKSGDTKLW